jgi:4-oxalocrotonate tautomerase
MPFVRVAVYEATPVEQNAAIAEAVYQAMRETIDIPAGDRFIVVTRHRKDELFVDPTYMGVQRSERFVLVHITLSQGRSIEKKQALYKRVAERLHGAIGVSTDDVTTVLSENTFVDWSFGKGEAQYVLNPPAWAQRPTPGD